MSGGTTGTPYNYNRINFPLYSVSPLSCNHVIVSGGGGAANTGVFNGFVSLLYSLTLFKYVLFMSRSCTCVNYFAGHL
jgi:hypothetical protein